MRRAIHAFIAVQLRIGAALSNAAEARFKAWARPRTDAVHAVACAPADSEARLRRYATTTAFADELVTTNAANLACRAGRLLCNGEKSSGARIVKTGDVLTLARPPGATNSRTRRRRETRRLDLEARTAPRRAPRRGAARATVAGALRGRRDGRRSKAGRPPRDELAEYAEAAAALPRRRLAAGVGTVAGRRRAPGAPAAPSARRARRWTGRHREVAVRARRAGRAFEQNEVDKEYGALVVGAVASGTINAPIDGLPSTTVVTARGQTPCAVDGVLTDVALEARHWAAPPAAAPLRFVGRAHPRRRLIWGPAQGHRPLPLLPPPRSCAPARARTASRRARSTSRGASGGTAPRPGRAGTGPANTANCSNVACC